VREEFCGVPVSDAADSEKAHLFWQRIAERAKCSGSKGRRGEQLHGRGADTP
jgi:hypothetical protein